MEADQAVRFIVASYGAKHVGMLLTHLHSIARSHPEARVAIYWQDIPARLIDALRAAFPRYDFHRTEFDFSNDFLLRISSKVHSWCRAAEEHASEPHLCLADVDTLILREVSGFFRAGRCGRDLHAQARAYRAEYRRAARARAVRRRRRSSASGAIARSHICRTPELYAQANDYSLGYGAADQMALWQMLGYERGRADFEITCGGERVRLRGEPCAVLNETNSLPVTDDKHILHYKAGWQLILLQGRPFTRNRPRETSWPMFALYLARFREALDALNVAAGTRFTAQDFGIVIPFYFEEETGGFDSTRYAVWRAREAGKSALRTLGYAARKLTGTQS